jgi:hypothetical protein
VFAAVQLPEVNDSIGGGGGFTRAYIANGFSLFANKNVIFKGLV